MIVPTTFLMMVPSIIISHQVAQTSSFAFVPPQSIYTTKILHSNRHNHQTISSTPPPFSLYATPPQNNEQDSSQNIDVINPLPQILRFRGPVATGYGRGGKKLGVPTANLPASLFSNALVDVDTGVYFGWAVIEGSSGEEKGGRNVIQKAVVNVGYSPTFEGKENAEKIIEAHLIINDDSGDEEIDGDFYGEVMRIQLIGSLRPEMKFPSFGELVAAIQNDIKCAREALGEDRFLEMKKDDFLVQVVGEEQVWVGSSGGDEDASWEFQDL